MVVIPVCRSGKRQARGKSGGRWACFLHSVSFVKQDLEDGVETCDFEQALDAFCGIQDGHVTISAPDRRPDRDQLAQTGTVDVAHVGNVQNEISLAFTQQAVDQITQGQIQDPESSAQVENDNVTLMSLNNRQRHTAIL